MGFAVEVFFDKASEKVIRELMVCAGEAESRPHLSLFVCPHERVVATDQMTESVRNAIYKLTAWELRFDVLGTFGSTEGVIMLVATLNEALRRLHARIYEVLVPYGHCDEFYEPGNWVPHCTIAIQDEMEKRIGTLQRLAANFSSLRVTVASVGIDIFSPLETIREWELEDG